MNSGSADGTKATDNMINEITNKNLKPFKLTELSKLLAGYEKGGAVIDPSTLGRLKNALIAKGEDPAQYTNRVSTQYKTLSSDMELKSGSGGLQYDTFAKNSTNEASKNIMGASFAKVNAKAKELNLDSELQLDENAGVNQKVDGVKLTALSLTMSGLIDDEIKSLQSVGDAAASDKIKQLQTAKARLDSGDISGLSLKNTDVSYKGATDSEKRQAEYNTTQHEIMHQAGAKNEDLVNESANTLQESKLIGRIPGTNQRYDEEIGKMIAGMEKTNTNPDAIMEAVAKKIDSWRPVSNAARVVETETGKRDSLKDALPEKADKGGTNKEGNENLVKAVDSIVDLLKKPAGASKTVPDMSIKDRNFFIKSFEVLKRTVAKSDEKLGSELKPLVSVATSQEEK